MAVVLSRASLTEHDKQYIRHNLLVTTTTEPPVVIKPLQVRGDEVRIPLEFYERLRKLREQGAGSIGSGPVWPRFPNDLRHPTRTVPHLEFRGQLYPQQLAVWEAAVGILHRHRVVQLEAHCGWGKTAFSSYATVKIGRRTLILYHVAPLGRSWPKTFADFTNARVCHVGHGLFDPDADVYIATVGSALSPSFPVDVSKIGVLIIDEAHCFTSPKRIFALLCCAPKYLFLLTATPNRANGSGRLLEFFRGEGDETRIVRISQRPFTVYRCKTALKPVIETTARGLDWSKVIESMITQPRLIKLICDWCTLNPHKKILIPCIQIAQINAIAEELRARGEDVQTMFKKDDSYDECRILVSIVQKCGVGFDDQNTCRNYGGRRIDMIILAWTIKDEGVTEQVCGRIRGANGTIVDIVHDFSSFEKHYRNRLGWYTSRNGTVEEVKGAQKIE